MEKTFKVFAFILFITLTACAQTPTSKLSKSTFTIHIQKPKRMRFSGKGAGAGMMLMSSMGPAGIAVGIAIDEGIGKDIGKAANEAGFSIERIVRKALPTLPSAFLENLQSVTINRYGFITQPGENDPVTPQLHLTFAYSNGGSKTLKFPEDIEPVSGCVMPLDQAKTKGKAVVGCFKRAAGVYLRALEEGKP